MAERFWNTVGLATSLLFAIPVIAAAIIPHRITKKDAEELSASAVIINDREIVRITDLSCFCGLCILKFTQSPII